MYRVKRLLVVYVVLGIVFVSKAQEAYYGTLGLRRVYHSTLLNPALIPDSSVVENSFAVSPFLLNLDMGMGLHLPFKLGDFTSSIDNGNTLNLNTLMSKVGQTSSADFNLVSNMSLFHFYFKVGENNKRIEFSQRFRTEGNTNFNPSLFGEIFGNDAMTQKLLDW